MAYSEREETKPTSDEFISALTELVDFKAYFTDDAQKEVLIKLLVDDWGMGRVKASLLVNRIAPFVIARLESLGKTVGTSVSKKLHAYLNKFDWYFDGTQALLNVLKTKNEKHFENALVKPTRQALEKLITDDKKWESLKPEFQGLLQLLLGIEGLKEGQELLKEQLTIINEELRFSLNLKTPSLISSEVNRIEKHNQNSLTNWLTYTHRQIPLVGRENSLKLLNNFYDQEANFSWWLITGAGGMGKSRLALESIVLREEGWYVGFLHKDKLQIPDILSHWYPKQPTIIIIDYAAEYPEKIKSWIDHLAQHQDSYSFPVRLLLIEREEKQQDWWGKLQDKGSAHSESSLTYLFTGHPLELFPLNKDKGEQHEALQNSLTALNSEIELPEHDNLFWQELNNLSNDGRPLFIAMVAIAIADKGISHIRNWDQEKLLDHVLQHERKIWNSHLDKLPEDHKRSILDLLALSTVIKGIDLEKHETQLIKGLLKCEVIDKARDFDSVWNMLETLTGRDKGNLQPDIFAEYYVLQYWKVSENKSQENRKRLFKLAYNLSPLETLAFMGRAATDFHEDKSTWCWWFDLYETNNKNLVIAIEKNLKKKSSKNKKHISKYKKKLTPLSEAAFNIIGKLSLNGKYRTALDIWLPSLCVTRDLRAKARAINVKAEQYHHLSKYTKALSMYKQSLEIRQKIGDKSGEGTTLNNISLIYNARGDYETALSYLEQSLEIRQEIGNKTGEGVTLNNLSLIYSAKGDYDTALSYLEQSLEIRQVIGDKYGEGTTLNNISQIYDARGDYETALSYLKQSLEIRQEIGDKAGKGTTLNNISQIYDARGDYETALSYLEQSLEILKEIGDKSGEGRALNNMSAIAHTKGDYDTALNYLEQSLEIQKEIGDKVGEGATLNNISQIFNVRGDYATALSYLEQSLEIEQEIGDKTGEGTTLNNISLIYFARGDYDTALSYLEHSLKIRQEIGDVSGMCATLLNIGNINFNKENIETAMKTWGKVYGLAKPMQLAKVMNALESLAEKLGLAGGVDGWEAFIPEA